jgi:hypothetical protein
MTNNNRERGVHFEEILSVGVAEVECIADEERERRWYTVSTILKETQVGPALNDQIFSSTNHFSLPQSKDIAVLRASYQKEQFCEERHPAKGFVQSFLAQQYEHQQLGIDDPRGLFQFSKACSKHSRKRAFLLAQENARESFCTKEDLVDSIDQVLGMLSTESFTAC